MPVTKRKIASVEVFSDIQARCEKIINDRRSNIVVEDLAKYQWCRMKELLCGLIKKNPGEDKEWGRMRL